MAFKTSTSIAAREDLYGAYMAYDPFVEDGFIADKVLPPWDAQEWAGQIVTITREAMQQVIDAKTAVDAPAPTSDFAFGSDTYSLVKYAYKEAVTFDRARQYRSFAELEGIVTQRVASILARAREIDTAAAVFNSTTFATAGTNLLTIGGGLEWDTTAGLPATNVATAKEYIVKRFGTEPDTLIMNYYLYSKLGFCTQIRDILGDNRDIPGMLPLETLSMIFGLPKIIVAKGVKNTANAGATQSGSYIWGNDNAMVCKTSNDRDITKPQLGRTLQLDGSGLDLRVYPIDDPEGNMINGKHIMSPKIMGEPAAVLIANTAA